VTPTTLRDPASHDMCTLFAGYLSKDIAGAGSRGDLCVWDVERYYRVPARWTNCPTRSGGAPAPVSLRDKVRNVAVYDHERFPGMSKRTRTSGAVPTRNAVQTARQLHAASRPARWHRTATTTGARCTR
jgi:hypothetical protein